jgi:outer membrane protein assembly factor BamD (BamD/ComL family)
LRRTRTRDIRTDSPLWRALFIPLLLLLTSGCSAVWWPSPSQRPRSEAEQLVARADALARDGEGRAALYLYQRVVREFPSDSAAAAALYGLGRLQSDPASGGLRNYRAASVALSRLVTEYPDSRWATDARAWQATLSDLLAREDEAARTKLQLRWREEETAALRLQIQQLRSVDLELERRR